MGSDLWKQCATGVARSGEWARLATGVAGCSLGGMEFGVKRETGGMDSKGLQSRSA